MWPGLLVGLLLLWRHGYVFAMENAYELIGLTMARLDPSLWARDWYTQAALAANVRAASTWLLAHVAAWVGLEAAFWGCFVACACGMGLALQALSRQLGGASPWPALLAVWGADRLAPWPGGNAFWAPVVSSSTFALPLALLGWAFLLGGRCGWAGLALGLAGLFHVQVGLAALGCALLALALRPGWRWQDGLALLLPFSLVAGPPLVLLLQDLAELRADPQAVLAVLQYRAPWHYLPWRPDNQEAWALVGAWFGLGLALLWPRRQEPAMRQALGLLLGLGLLASMALLGQGLGQPELLKFQPLRLIPCASVLVLLLLGQRLLAWLQAHPPSLQAAWLPRVPVACWALPFVVLAWGAVDAGLALRWPERPAWWPPTRHHLGLNDALPSEQVALAAWLRTHTPQDALLLSPPQLEGLRVHSQRAIVVDFKNLAFSDRAILSWDERVRLVGRAKAYPSERWRQEIALVAEGYAQQSWPELVALAQRFGATHVVTQRPHPEWPAVYAQGGFWVHQLSR